MTRTFAGELLREEIGSAICAPVLSKDEVVGVLNLSRNETSDVFTLENMHVVTSFAGQLGIANWRTPGSTRTSRTPSWGRSARLPRQSTRRTPIRSDTRTR